MEKNRETADRELRLSRLLNAPIEQVWEVWTNPEQIKNWWGPIGFTTTISKMDVSVDGKWDLMMHGPDGTDYQNKSIFREVIHHRKLVYDHISGPRFLATIEFEAQGEQTKLSWHMLFESKEQFIQVVKTFKADEGLKQNIDKLSSYVRAQLIASNLNHPIMKTTDKIIHEKILHAPVEMVWKALTDREQLKQWYFDFPETYEPEVGRVFDWYAEDLEGKQWQHRGKMLVVIEGEKLVHTWEYVGYEGSSTVSWELEALDDHITKLYFVHEFQVPFDRAIDAFKKENFVGGWDYIIYTSLVDFLKKQG